MLGSGFEAEDAVQETMVRAWRNADGFEGRSSVRSWLYRIATNVCIDMQRQVQRRARPMEMGPSSPPDESLLGPMLPEATWVTPIPDAGVGPESADPAEIAQYRESIRLAFVTALQHLPARQRAALILCEVLRWQVAEVAELLDTSVAAVNSALQRARATLRALPRRGPSPTALDDADAELLERYVDAFERYDIERLVTLLHEDAVQSMPPFAMWIQGAADIGRWMVEPGPSGCRGSRLVADLGQRLPGLRAVPARPGRRLRAVGAPGARDLRGEDRRDELLPRLPGPRAALPPVRPAPPSRRVGRPARGARCSAGETSVERRSAAEALGQQRQAGHVVHGPEVRMLPGPRARRGRAPTPSGSTTVTRHQRSRPAIS